MYWTEIISSMISLYCIGLLRLTHQVGLINILQPEPKIVQKNTVAIRYIHWQGIHTDYPLIISCKRSQDFFWNPYFSLKLAFVSSSFVYKIVLALNYFHSIKILAFKINTCSCTKVQNLGHLIVTCYLNCDFIIIIAIKHTNKYFQYITQFVLLFFPWVESGAQDIPLLELVAGVGSGW